MGMYLPHSACPHSQPFPANLLGLAFLGASRLEKLLSRFNNILFGSQLLQILFVTMHVSPFVPEYVLSFEIVRLPSIEFLWGKKALDHWQFSYAQKDSDIETNRNDYLSKRLINDDPPNTTQAANLVLRFDRHLLLGHLSQLPPCPPRRFLHFGFAGPTGWLAISQPLVDFAKLVAQNF